MTRTLKPALVSLLTIAAIGCADAAASDAVPGQMEAAKPIAAALKTVPQPLESAEPAPISDTSIDDVESEHSNLALELRAASLTTEVVDRQPVDERTHFAPREKAMLFVNIANPSSEVRNVALSFEGPNGVMRRGPVLSIPAGVKRWRTWGYSRQLKAPGSWVARVVDVASEETMTSIEFEIDAPTAY